MLFAVQARPGIRQATVKFQPGYRPQRGFQLKTINFRITRIAYIVKSAGNIRKLNLDLGPVDIIDRAVEDNLILGPGALPANFVIPQGIRVKRRSRGLKSTRLVRSAQAETLCSLEIDQEVIVNIVG